MLSEFAPGSGDGKSEVSFESGLRHSGERESGRSKKGICEIDGSPLVNENG